MRLPVVISRPCARGPDFCLHFYVFWLLSIKDLGHATRGHLKPKRSPRTPGKHPVLCTRDASLRVFDASGRVSRALRPSGSLIWQPAEGLGRTFGPFPGPATKKKSKTDPSNRFFRVKFESRVLVGPPWYRQNSPKVHSGQPLFGPWPVRNQDGFFRPLAKTALRGAWSTSSDRLFRA